MRVRALALAGVSALLLTACGGGADDDGSFTRPRAASSGPAAEQSGAELVAAAADALEQAGSVHIQGTVPTGATSTDVDLRLVAGDAAGTLTVAGQTVQVVLSAGNAFVQADATFWQSQGVPPAALGAVDGVWVKAPGDPGASLGVLTLPGLVTLFRQSSGTVADAVTAAEVDGQPVWEVRSSGGAVMRVASEGPSYPLEFQAGAQPGVLRLSEFGAVAPIEAPTEFFDASGLGG